MALVIIMMVARIKNRIYSLIGNESHIGYYNDYNDDKE